MLKRRGGGSIGRKDNVGGKGNSDRDIKNAQGLKATCRKGEGKLLQKNKV